MIHENRKIPTIKTKLINQVDFNPLPHNDKEKSKIKFADIILNGFFTMIFVLLVYLFAERSDIVPTLRFYSDNIPILPEGNGITIAESVISLTIIFEISWILANLIYWRLIRNKKIIF